MILHHPEFKKLELSDKDHILQFTKHHPPYSDYNFTSLWSWNTDNSIEISQLNDNLIVKFSDYNTGEPVFSFLGENKTQATIQSIFEILEYQQHKKLSLVSESSIKNSDIISQYVFIEDRDNFDYIYFIPDLAECRGRKYETMRNLSNRFIRRYPNYKWRNFDFTEKKEQQDILNLLDTWENNKQVSEERERSAIQRYMDLENNGDKIDIGFFVNDKLVGFSFVEVLSDSYAIAHFVKADTKYAGIYSIMAQTTAKQLHKKKATLLNYEQDLGIENLRKAKMSMRPISFLKKYIIVDSKNNFTDFGSIAPQNELITTP